VTSAERGFMPNRISFMSTCRSQPPAVPILAGMIKNLNPRFGRIGGAQRRSLKANLRPSAMSIVLEHQF
jgi:hypothetical protein